MAKTADFKVVVDSTWVSEYLAEWLQEERADAWDEGNAQAMSNVAWQKVRKENPYRTEQNND